MEGSISPGKKKASIVRKPSFDALGIGCPAFDTKAVTNSKGRQFL
jgi:hypothetical protein